MKTTTNRFICSSLQPGFYQEVVTSVLSFQELGNKLVRYAERARAFRLTDKVQEASQLLVNLPLKEFQSIGCYYLGWSLYRSGQYEQAEKLLLQVVSNAPTVYQSRAMLSLAGVEAIRQNHDSEREYYIESLKASLDVSTAIEAYRGIAIVKAKEGYHASSVKDFERLLSLSGKSDPVVHHAYLNSLATELGEVGRKGEARDISRIVLASPFIHAYPEWLETAQELKGPDRSRVVVPHFERESVQIESTVTQHASKEVEATRPGTVIAFPQLKEAPEPKRPDPINMREFSHMSLAEKKEYILSAVRTELLHESEYNKLIYLLGLIKIDPASNVIDLEDKALLSDLIEVWCYTIDPEELAGVISALRDCEDDQRRESIMDDMIMFAYQHTPDSKESESEWRRKVERKLPDK